QVLGAEAATGREGIDVAKGARDWPQLNFVIYHSAYFPGDTPLPDGTVVPGGIEQFASVLEANPDIGNDYAEIGSTFAVAVANGGAPGQELMGKLLKQLGSVRGLRGTDSDWVGPPHGANLILPRI